MDLRALPLQNIARTVARIIFLASVLSRQSGVESGSPVNCKSIDRFMSQSAIKFTKIAKNCELIRNNIYVDPSELTGCINDRILFDETSAKDLATKTCDLSRRKKRSFALDYNLQNYQSKKWPIPIPYNISLSSSRSSEVTTTILDVIAYVAAEACVRFSQTTADQMLSFQDGDGCLSYQGRSENPLTRIVLMASCYSFGEILSLVATSLGLADDATRPDSSNYVYVNSSNINPSDNIFILPIPPYSYYGFPYDYASVTHSNPLRFSKNGQITIRTLDPLYQNTIGQRVQLSFPDTKLINTMYCSGSCAGTTNTCQQGGYPDPNSCNLCKCPDGWSDRCVTLASHDSGQCGQQSYDLSVTTSGVIQSPGYDSQGYDPNAEQQCTWLLTAPPGSHVTITFLQPFDIYQVNLACYHWIEVRFDGNLNETGPRFCGSAPLAQTMKSTGNQLMLLFRSFTSADRTYKGFKIEFHVDPCTVIWSDPITNTLTYGGKEAQGPLSKEGCLATCEMTPTCNAVDLDYSSIDSTKYPRCFLLTIAPASPLNNQAQGVVEYRIIDRCSNSTTTTTTASTPTTTSTMSTSSSTMSTSSSTMSTTSMSTAVSTAPLTVPAVTSTTTTSAGPNQACFTRLDTTQSPGGTFVRSGITVADCLSHCLGVGCAGVDYVINNDPQVTECWEHQTTNELLIKAYNPVINQYINNCNASSAAPSSTSTSTSASTSTSMPTSTSTSTSTSTTTTTTTTSTPTKSTTTPTTTTTTSVGPTFSFGPTVCPTSTVRLAGVQSSGSTKNDSIRTEADCVNFCLVTSGCVGVDVVTATSPQECWIYTDPSGLVNKFSNKDVVQYTFTRNCQSDSSPAVQSTTASSGSCQNSWLIYNNSHSVGASKLTQPLLLPDCLGRCAEDTNCVAVDFNSAANPIECWVHTNQANLNQRYAQKDITQYVLNVRCPTTAAPNPGCGGANGNPGVMYPPCSRPTNPPTTCVNKVITFVFQGGCWTQRVDYVSVGCQVLSCSGNARLASIEGGQQCVVPGWGPWSSCSASCGSFGFQVRYNYDICGSNSQYITVGQEQRICNAQVCPCSASWGCSRCCSGYYESSGYCYRM